MRRLTECVIHCTATPEGRDFSVAQIDAMHRKRGFDGIGYHFLIGLDGTVYEGRHVERVGAHVAGRNATTIGIAYVGGVDAAGRPKDTRTDAQRAAMITLLRDLLRRFPAITAISGHNEFANKACPCFNARREYSSLVPARAMPVGLMNGETERPETYRVSGRGFALLDGPFGSPLVPLDKGVQVETLGQHSGDWILARSSAGTGWLHLDAIDTSELSEPLGQSRTMRGIVTASAGAGINQGGLDQIVATLEPVTGTSQTIATFVAWLKVIGAVLTVLGLVYAAYARWDDAGRPLPRLLRRAFG